LFIFTTAISQYAVECFELNAVDYLVATYNPLSSFYLKAISRQESILTKIEKPNIEKIFFLLLGKPSVAKKYYFCKAEYESINKFKTILSDIQGLKDYLKNTHSKHK